MSCGIFVPNSFVLPIPKMERQSCSYAGSLALKVKFNLTAPALHFQCAVPTLVLLAVSGFTQIGLGCGRPAALRSFVLGGACVFYAASDRDERAVFQFNFKPAVMRNRRI